MGLGESPRGPQLFAWNTAAVGDIEAVRGDLTLQSTEALVNAANSTLLGGGGVDGALHAAAGPELLAACRKLRATDYPDGLPVGQAVATPAGRLSARWVIHTVGPNRHRGQTNPADLAAAYTHSLDVAVTVGAHSVAFPAIGAGVYGWDADQAAQIAVEAVVGHARTGIRLVRFVLFSDRVYQAFAAALRQAVQ